MFLINEILVSDDVLTKSFCCDLGACKGACCVEGDFGAPLEPSERVKLREVLPDVFPDLDEVSQNVIAEEGVDRFFVGMSDFGTVLRPDGACAFAIFDEDGKALCGIEKQYRAGKIDFKKPLSCELYPIRVTKDEDVNFMALNYDDWTICKPAIKNGSELGLPLVHFLKDALIRGYGQEFYDALEAARVYNKQSKE